VKLVKEEHGQAQIDSLPCKVLLKNCIRFLAAIFAEFDCTGKAVKRTNTSEESSNTVARHKSFDDITFPTNELSIVQQHICLHPSKQHLFTQAPGTCSIFVTFHLQ